MCACVPVCMCGLLSAVYVCLCLCMCMSVCMCVDFRCQAAQLSAVRPDPPHPVAGDGRGSLPAQRRQLPSILRFGLLRFGRDGSRVMQFGSLRFGLDQTLSAVWFGSVCCLLVELSGSVRFGLSLIGLACGLVRFGLPALHCAIRFS